MWRWIMCPVIHTRGRSALCPRLGTGAGGARLGVGSRPTTLFLGGLRPARTSVCSWHVLAARAPAVPGAVLLIAGAGPLRASVPPRGRRARPRRFSDLPGRVAGAEKVRFYQIADLFVFPSSLEGFGLSVAEAMSCGLPVLCGQQGALPEPTGGGVDAAVFDPGKPQELVSGRLPALSRAARGGRTARTGRVSTRFSDGIER